MARTKIVTWHPIFAGGVSGLNNPGGATYYVGSQAAYDGATPSDTLDGLTPQTAKATIQAALDLCVTGRGDTVALLPGTITITAAITMTKDDVTLMSANPVGRRERSPAIITIGDTDVNMLEINANNVTVAGITFDDNVATATADSAAVKVNTASTAADYVGFKMINCYIDMGGSDTDRDALVLGFDATDGAIGALVEGCTILDCGQDAIVINVGSEYTEVRDCNIVDAAKTTRYGVEVLATSVNIEACTIWTSTAGGACIHNGVAAARLRVTDCRLHGFTTTTKGIEAINTATQQTTNNWVVSGAASMLIDYLTDNTTPSADAGTGGIFAASPGATALITPSVT